MFDVNDPDPIPEAELIDDDAAEDCLAPLPLAVRGRGHPRCAAHVDRSGVTLRRDDAKNPEFWAEIRCERFGLFELIRRSMEAQRLEPL